MQQNSITSKKILDYLRQYPGSSSTDMAKDFHVTPVAIFYHLRELIQEDVIEVYGKSRATRYYIKVSSLIPYDTTALLSDALQYIRETYRGAEDIDVEKLLEENLLILTPEGNWRSGMDALYEIIKKENQSQAPSIELFSRRLRAFLDDYFEQEQKRRKNGFFDGTESIRYTLEKYGETCHVDHVYFSEMNKLGHWGKLRTGTELYHGKSLQDKKLLIGAVDRTISRVEQFLTKKGVDAIVLTPPTLPRRVQFRDVFIERLGDFSPIISAEKLKHRDFRPQKELKGKDRFINAEVSVSVDMPKYIAKLHHIAIIDDNFTTGATVNAIAGKLRTGGFTGEITVITITGNFGYVPGVTDDEEI